MSSKNHFSPSNAPKANLSVSAASAGPSATTASIGDSDDSENTLTAWVVSQEARRPSATPQISPCCVSFTGFREDEEWESDSGDDKDGDKEGAQKRGEVTAEHHRSELEVCEQLALHAGLVVHPTLMSSTNILVARRGLTKKRLLASLSRIPTVLPRWMEDGCPFSSSSSTLTARDAGTAQLHASNAGTKGSTSHSVDVRYAVPWLHGYMFSTTGLSSQEKAAIEHICVNQHGATVEAGLTYRCDVLLTSAECIRSLQELLRRDALGALAGGAVNLTQTKQKEMTVSTDADNTREGKSSRAKGKKRGKGKKEEEAEKDVPRRAIDTWLTDKLRFALEFDIPVVDYVKLFSLLRLDRLPPPTLDLAAQPMERGDSSDASLTETKQAKRGSGEQAAALTPEMEAALRGGDFEAVVEVCRVTAPAGGSARWRSVLDRAVAVEREQRVRSISIDEKEVMQGESDQPDVESSESEGAQKADALCEASISSSRASSSTASTVSDPDAWEDFMQHMLVPHWPQTEGGNNASDGQHPRPQRFSVYPPEAAVPNANTKQRNLDETQLTLNTADVDVQPTAASTTLATQHVASADYYSGTGASNTVSECRVLTSTCQYADSYHDSNKGDYLTLGISQVDPSPRLTTNALLQREQPPPSPQHPLEDKPLLSRSAVLAPRAVDGSNFGDCIAAYYAAQRSEQPPSHRMPTSIAPLTASVNNNNNNAAAAAAAATSFHQSLEESGRRLINATTDSLRPSFHGDSVMNETFSVTTQVLVESCAVHDVEQAQPPSTPAVAQSASTALVDSMPRRDFLARVTMPLWAMHPPHLHLSLLGCTTHEEQQARNWCGVCRFMCYPVPSFDADVVVLGSRVLARKKYTLPAATNEARGVKSARERSLRAASAQKYKAKPDSAVSVRYWEMDAVVARVLTDTYGVAVSRLAPLRWLEDAAAASQTAAADAEEQQREKEKAAALNAQQLTANVDDALTFTDGGTAAVETTSTPQETLAELLQERADEVRKKDELLHEAAPPPASFYPLPVLRPEQLPPLTSPSYYIRLRRSYTTAAPAGGEKSSSTRFTAVQKPLVSSAAPQPVRRNGEEKQQPQLTLPQPASAAASETSVGDPYSPRSGVETLRSERTNDNTPFSSKLNSSSTFGQPLSNAEIELTAATTASSVSSMDLRMTTTAIAPQAPRTSNGRNGKDAATMHRNTEAATVQDDAVATAARRFSQLLALFTVESDAGSHGTSLHDESKQTTPETAAITTTGATSSGTAESARRLMAARRHVLQSCCFCCVEGDYARVEWGVLRGLVRYGGGVVEKKTAEAWTHLLAKAKDKKPLHSLSQPKADGAAGAASTKAQTSTTQQQQQLAARVRRNMEYEKQQRKLTRLLLQLSDTQNIDNDQNSTTAFNHAREVKKVQVAKVLLTSKTAASAASAEEVDVAAEGEQRNVDEEAVEKLKAKLRNTARGCQQTPVFYLLPHSFQRAPPAPTEKKQGHASDAPESSKTNAIASPLQPHALRGLVGVTQDYVLACIAVASCLDPHSCFIFYRSIPSAPDGRLFHARSASGVMEQQPRSRQSLGLTPYRPAISAWMREKRYSKPESVGVCVAFLWRLPALDSQWVTSFPSSEEARSVAPAPLLSTSRKESSGTNKIAPSVHLVPLMRVLLLGFRNAVEAMGGHVVDTFAAASTTHVVVVDVAAIVSRTLADFFTSDVRISDKTNRVGDATPPRSQKTASECGEVPYYWPAEDVPEAVRCAAQQEVSLVTLDWLEHCVEWGTFLDEAPFAPPKELEEQIAHFRLQEQRARELKQRQRRLHPSQPTSDTYHHQQRDQQSSKILTQRARSQLRRSGLSTQSIRDGSAARIAEARKRCRTPSPPPTDSTSLTATAPDAQRTTAAPHTPPRPWSVTRIKEEESDGVSTSKKLAAPPLSFISSYPPVDAHAEDSQRLPQGSVEAPQSVHTPVMRRLLPPGSASNSNSNAEPFTPPPRPPAETTFGLRGVPQMRSAHHFSPQPTDNNHATPPMRGTSRPTPQPLSAGRSHSVHSSPHSYHRRSTPSLPASQRHNTFSHADQQDAEAYVEHLGSMFNFCSPGSTPLPSSARRGPRTSTRTPGPRAQVEQGEEDGDDGSGEVMAVRTPLPKAFCNQMLRQIFDPAEANTTPAATQLNSTADVSNEDSRRMLASQPLTQTQRESSLSCGVLSTPRRRTLRGVAAAAAASASAASITPARATQTPLNSPDRHRHRHERNALSTTEQREKTVHKALSNEREGESVKEVWPLSATAHKASEQRGAASVVPVVLGDGSGTLVSHRATERRSDVNPAELSQSTLSDSKRTPEKTSERDRGTEEALSAAHESQSMQASKAQSKREADGAEVWVARTPSSSQHSVDESNDAEQPMQQPSSNGAGATDVLCRFSGEMPISDDEATVPLPCAGSAFLADATALVPETGDSAALHKQSVPDFTLMGDVIPDSQPEEETGSEAAGNEVLAPASFIAATDGAYYETAHDSFRIQHNNNNNEDETREVSSAQKNRPVTVLAADRSESEETDAQNTPSQRMREELQEEVSRDTVDVSQTLASQSVRTGTAEREGSRPRLGISSVPRQPSPTPFPPPSSSPPAPAVIDVDGEADSSKEAEETAKNKNNTKRKDCQSAEPQHTPLKVLPEPAPAFGSPWTRHRPLSVSRRTSQSPVPTSHVAEHTHHQKRKESEVRVPVVAAAPQKNVDTLRAPPALFEDVLLKPVPFCLRVYVLHDLPHRELRVQRCRNALDHLMQENHSPTTPTLVPPTGCDVRSVDTSNNNNSNSSSKKADAKATSRVAANCDVGDTAYEYAQSAAWPRDASSESSVPPVCFVSRCEDADVCVTHEVSLRESVLVAIALGCWVVQPGFLECVAAVLDGFSGHRGARHRAGVTTEQELHLLPHPHAPNPTVPDGMEAATMSKQCYQRLCEMCPTYEWTVANAGSSATSASTASPSPIHRALLLQCRRQRQAAQARLRRSDVQNNSKTNAAAASGAKQGEMDRFVRVEGQHVGAAGGLSNVFACTSFLLFSAVSSLENRLDGNTAEIKLAASAARVQAIRRLLVAGGGDVLSTTQVGCVQNVSAHTGFPSSSQHGVPPPPVTQLSEKHLRCCRCWVHGSEMEGERAQATKGKANTAVLRSTTDAELYHDLILVLCDAVRCHTQRSVKRVPQAVNSSNQEDAALTSGRRRSVLRDSEHSTVQNADTNKPLVVLLDASLLCPPRTPENTDWSGGGTARGTCEKTANESKENTRQSFKRSRDAPQSTENGTSNKGVQCEEESEKMRSAAAQLIPPSAFSVISPNSAGLWLMSWLSASDGEREDEERGFTFEYTNAARHAMRAHLSACCSFVRHVAEELSVAERSVVAPMAGQPNVSSASFTTAAEKRWSYRVSDIPFQVASLDEVIQRVWCGRDALSAVFTDLHALATSWEAQIPATRQVLFRSAGWAGACVAAGGADALARSPGGATAHNEGGALTGASGRSEANAWMSECEQQTLLAVLSY